MADPSVGWCGRLSPCLHGQPWPPAALVGEPVAELAAAPPLPEPDPAIERLLALCAGGTESQALIDDDADASQCSSASEEILSNQDLTLDKAMIARDLLGECDLPSADGDGEPVSKRPCRAPPEPGELPGLSLPPPPPPPLPPRSASPPAEELRKSVSVGADHQAELPALRPAAGRRRARPSPGDRLLWDPSRLPELEVERYQRRLRPTVVSAAASSAAPPAAAPLPPHHLADHEQALRHLQESGHNVQEAARRLGPDQLHPGGRLSHWSGDECCLFEQALRLHGKDFSTIQRQMLPARSVGEIVNFYYLWKKTERHRQFLSLSQLDKRKLGADSAICGEPSPRVLSTAASSLQILMAADPWDHGVWAAEAQSSLSPPSPPPPPPPPAAAGLVSLLASCPQLLLP